MKVFPNGVPKMGTHALWKALELLGIRCDDVNHTPYGQPVPEGVRRIFIKRDPRNALVSWLRFRGQPVTQGTFIAALSDPDGPSPVGLPQYEGWLDDPDTFIVSFEALIASDAEMRRMAAWLGVPYLEDAWPNLPGHTSTWTGRYSDYSTIWSPVVDEAWVNAGGPALLARWGY